MCASPESRRELARGARPPDRLELRALLSPRPGSFSLSLSLNLRTERDRLLYSFLYGRAAQISMSYARTSAGGSIVSCLHPRSVDSLSRRGDN